MMCGRHCLGFWALGPLTLFSLLSWWNPKFQGLLIGGGGEATVVSWIVLIAIMFGGTISTISFSSWQISHGWKPIVRPYNDKFSWWEEYLDMRKAGTARNMHATTPYGYFQTY